MLIELIMFGGVIFWALMGLLALFAVMAINWENGSMAAVWLVLAVLVTVLFTDAALLNWLAQSIGTLLLALPVYLVIGGAWALVKWSFFVRRVRAWADDWIAEHPLSGFTPAPNRTVVKQRHVELQEAAGYQFHGGYGSMKIPPEPGQHGDRVARWVGYWPLSVIADVIGDGLEKLIELVRSGLSGIMRKISGNAFKDFDAA